MADEAVVRIKIEGGPTGAASPAGGAGAFRNQPAPVGPGGGRPVPPPATSSPGAAVAPAASFDTTQLEARGAVGLLLQQRLEKRYDHILEVEARASLQLVQERQRAQKEREEQERRSVIEMQAAAEVQLRDRRRFEQEQEDRYRHILDIEARAALQVVQDRQRAEKEREDRQRHILEIEARAALQVAQERQRAEKEREEAERKSVAQLEARGEIGLREQRRREAERDDRQRHILEIEAKAALQVARDRQKGIADALRSVVQHLLGVRIPQGALGGGARAAALFGVPGAAYQAYRTYQTQGPEAAVASAASSAGTLAVLRTFTDALISATSAVGRFAVGLVSPDANPANFVATIGGAVSGVSSALFALNPALGAFAGVVGASISVLGDFMRAMDGMVERYAMYSPEVAMAKAQADVAQIMGDMRRSSQVAPDLVKYLQQRTEMQQKFEDEKIKFIHDLMPVAITMMGLVEDMLPTIRAIAEAVAFLAKMNLTSLLKEILKMMQRAEDEEAAKGHEEFDFMKMVKEGFVLPGEERGVRTPMGHY